MSEFVLSCELLGHEEDVRGICVADLEGSSVATSSRDKTLKVWQRQAGTPPSFALDKTLVGHKSFVGPICSDPRHTAEHPQGLLVSGGMDSQVIVWDVARAEAAHTLQGHQQQVTAVAVGPPQSPLDGCIISASIDRTIRIWKDGKCLRSLEGHESSVLALVVRPNGDIYSGSGDCTIKCWRDGNCFRSFKAHSDSVRGLAEMPGLGLLSASHDGSVKLWDWEGTQLLEMVGHTALVYSVAASLDQQDGCLASGSEDCSARVWKNGSCEQVLEHPGCVWGVAFLPNGDLLTACGDGVARVWTRDAARRAPEDVATRFQEAMAAQKRSKTVGGVKVADLPGPEALQHPEAEGSKQASLFCFVGNDVMAGRKNGQTKVVREGDVGVAYSWNAKEYNWDRIGEVVDGPSDPTEARTLDGVTYDYLFDVDIGDGVPVRKLPYNFGENPYEVADKWLLSQDLPLTYREQVVQFITQNTGQGGAGLPMGNTIPDPYTGGQAYVPQAPGRAGGAASVAASRGPEEPSLPKRTVLVFDTAQYDGILKKLKEFNGALGTSTKQAPVHPMTAEQLARLGAIAGTLRDSSHWHSSTFAPADTDLLAALLASWPAPSLFPLLDLLRLMLLHPSSAALLSARAASPSQDVLMPAIRRAAEGQPPVAANQLTALRVAVNACRHKGLFSAWLATHRSEILDLYAGSASSTNKNVRIAFATLLLNYSLLLAGSKDEDGQVQVLSAAYEAAGESEEDPVAKQRALLALATLMEEGGTVKQMAQELEVGALFKAASKSPNAEVAALGAILTRTFS